MSSSLCPLKAALAKLVRTRGPPRSMLLALCFSSAGASPFLPILLADRGGRFSSPLLLLDACMQQY